MSSKGPGLGGRGSSVTSVPHGLFPLFYLSREGHVHSHCVVGGVKMEQEAKLLGLTPIAGGPNAGMVAS